LSFLVRKAKQLDVSDLAKAWYDMSLEIWRKHKCPIYKPKPKEEFVKAASEIFSRKLRSNKYLIFVAIENGTLAGFVVARVDHYVPSVFVQEKLIYVEKLFVAKRARRKGVGSVLMEKILSEAKKKHVRIVYLSTEIDDRNLAFYGKLGFERYQYKLMKMIK